MKHNKAIRQLIEHALVPIHHQQSILWQFPSDAQLPWEIVSGLVLPGYRIHRWVMQLMIHQQ